MRYIAIETLENGAHDNFTTSETIETPEGWCLIPEEIEIPETFPFVHFKYKKNVVIEMTPGVVPPPEPKPEPQPTAEDILNALLGVTE